MRPDPAVVPADVTAVLRTLRGAKKQAWLAGGAVRDVLRGVPAQDFDVATDALPEEVAKLCAKVIPTGMQHGTVTVVSGDHNVEVTTFRGEGPYLDGRRPSSVTFLGDIDGDLARRDFTVNAMAWDPIAGELRDPFGGALDLRRGLLRAVGEPLDRFREDGLRPLRAVDFAPPDLTVRLAALLHDVGKPRSAQPPGPRGEHTFYKHEFLGEEMAREILLRLRYPNRQTERVALLVREHNWHYLPEWNDATVRRTIARIGPDALPDLWALRRADLQARGRLVAEGLANQQQVETRFEAELHRAAALRVTDLAIGGEEVMAVTGIAPGKRVGEILTGLLDRVLDDPDLNTREALMRLASEMARTPSTGNPQR